MKSRITIEVDFEKGNLPVIQILQGDSDDVRDRLISQLLQSLGHTSRWCTIQYKGEYQPYGKREEGDPLKVNMWHIVPITVDQIPEEIGLMQGVIGRGKFTGTNIHDNSIGFRKFLDESNITYHPNEHGTIIPAEINPFELGKKYEKYKQEYGG